MIPVFKIQSGSKRIIFVRKSSIVFDSVHFIRSSEEHALQYYLRFRYFSRHFR